MNTAERIAELERQLVEYQTKHEVACSTLDIVKEQRTAAQKALAEQCKQTKQLERQNEVLREALQEVKEWDINGWTERGFALPTELRAKIHALLGGTPAAVDAGEMSEREFNAKRLRRVMNLLGLNSAVPESGAELLLHEQWAHQHSSSRIGSDKGPCNCGADRTAAVDAVNQGPKAYCKAYHDVGMSNCGNFDECDGATCITCHRPLNSPAATDAGGQS